MMIFKVDYAKKYQMSLCLILNPCSLNAASILYPLKLNQSFVVKTSSRDFIIRVLASNLARLLMMVRFIPLSSFFMYLSCPKYSLFSLYSCWYSISSGMSDVSYNSSKSQLLNSIATRLCQYFRIVFNPCSSIFT